MMNTRELNLRDYLHLIQKRRFTIITFLIVAVVLTVIVTFSMTPVYMSSTKLFIEKAEPASFIKDYGYSSYDPEFFQTQFELIKSLAVSRRVVDILGSDKEFISYYLESKERKSFPSRVWAGIRELWEDEPPEANVRIEGEQANIIAKKIAKEINVSPVRSSKIIDVSFSSESPALARMIANSVAKAYIEAVLDMRMSFSKYTIEWMAKKVDEERTRLDEYEKDLQQYVKENDIVTLEDRIAIIPEQLSELSTKLIRAETHRKELEVLYEKLEGFSKNLDAAETMPVIASDETVRSLRERVLQKEQLIMELSKKYGRKHPQMIQAKSDLDGLKEKKRGEIRRVIESIRNEYDLAVENEKNLKGQMDATKAEAFNMSEKYVQYGILKRETDTSRQLYDSLIKKMKEQSITEEIQDVNIWIVEEAPLPSMPVSPRKTVNILLGLFIGLGGGIGIAFILEHLDNTVKSLEDAEEKLKAPVLGSVTMLKENNEQSTASIQKVVLDEPRSVQAESYKRLRTSIMLSSADARPRSILVTSMVPGEGKSTTASNLALALAQNEKNVLLIDADMRKPVIHKAFGLSNERGLSTYLTGDDSELIQKGPLPGLDIIPSGPLPPNPSELLDSATFKSMVEEFRNRYDYIVCDSPPMLSVTDPILLSQRFDGTVIVVRAGKTPYEAAHKGIRMLQDVNSHMLGFFINAVNTSQMGYYYGTYNYYSYQESSEPPGE